MSDKNSNDWREIFKNSDIYAVLVSPVARLVAVLILCAVILGVISVVVRTNTPCREMLNWAISSVPARCLAELSEMKPK